MADVADGLARLPKMAADDAVRFLADQLGYGKYLDKNGMDRTKLAVLEMLGAQEPTPRHLLRRLEKLRSIIQNHENPPGCRFLLSTIHSAKGLEYDRVILLDVLDGILPAKPELCCRTPGETQQYEEDRRLFYVAMTRARQQLVLFDCAAERSAFVDEVLSGLPGHRKRHDAEPAGRRTPTPAARAARGCGQHHRRRCPCAACRLWSRHRGKRCGPPRDRALYGRSAHTGRPGRRGAASDVGGVKCEEPSPLGEGARGPDRGRMRGKTPDITR